MIFCLKLLVIVETVPVLHVDYFALIVSSSIGFVDTKSCNFISKVLRTAEQLHEPPCRVFVLPQLSEGIAILTAKIAQNSPTTRWRHAAVDIISTLLPPLL